MTEHLTFDALNDLVGGYLSADERSRAAAHLEQCSQCSGTLTRLRNVVVAAPNLRVPEAAPASSWPAIQARIERTKHVSFPRPLRRRRSRIVPLIAAAVVLFGVTSFATRAILHRPTRPSAGVANRTKSAVPALPADFVGVERRYLVTAQELERSLDSTEHALPRPDMQRVRANLGVIDSAIDEARSALVSDPNSEVIRDILGKNYERKLEFLRQAAARSIGED